MRSVMVPLLGDRVDDISFSIPFGAIPLILLITILLAMVVSAFMMIMAVFAKTFKEAQSMVSPFVTLMVIPGGVFLQIPGIVSQKGSDLVRRDVGPSFYDTRQYSSISQPGRAVFI